MALGAYAIITLAEAKDFLGFENSYSEMDTYIETLINQASLAIEARIDNKVADQTITDEILSGDGADILRPRYFPIVRLSAEASPSDAEILAALQYRTDPSSSWGDLMDTASHILVDPLWDYIQLYDSVFPVGTRNIKLTYQAGYETIPGDLFQVCIEKVADMFAQSKKGMGRFGIQSQSSNAGSGSGSVTYKSFTAEHDRILRRYAKKTNTLSAYR